jgi:uncharacterized protein (DUF58 family)
MEERISSQPPGVLLSKIGLLAILAGLLLAAWNGQIVVATVLGLVLAAAGFARLWSRFSLVGVSCQRLLSEQRAFPGEYIELKLQLSNRKLLPLPWIQIDDEMPLGFAPDILPTPENRLGFGFLSKAAAILWYSKVSWKSQLYCRKRGYYKLGPVKITSGDIFGFYPRSVTEPSIDHIIVYPEIFSIEQLGIPLLYPLGNAKAARPIFEDPTRVMGVRDYKPDDSLRRIHWKATARHQNLKVKILEPTTTLDVVIFLAIDSFKHDSNDDNDFELGISTAASIAKYIIDKGSPAGLLTNTRLADSGQPARILPGSNSFQLTAILEALAKVTHNSNSPFEEFLNRERRSLTWGTTLIFILHDISQPLNIMFTNLKEAGYKLLIYQIGKQKKADTQDSDMTYHIPKMQIPDRG